MKTVKTIELSGPALDYAVAKAVGSYELIPVPPDADGKNEGWVLAPKNLLSSGYAFPPKGKLPINFFISRYSGDWAECGRLLEHYMIDVSFDHDEEHEPWSATSPLLMGEYFTGKNAKVAICRAVVGMSKLGDTVEIPEELLK
ncbi:phage protein NinX family protein [Morganella morganii]|uniref:phage protein NinX family protein n=1 Tax=Morganella morganii TaxID=582 RepID=UPI0025A4D1DD|nr:phage protein NinX family protein [Morganella morganii]